VEQAARELGYRPNLAARSLRTSSSLTIGLVSDTIASEPFAGHFIRGALAVAREHDQLLLIGETEGQAWLERDVVSGMLDRQIDGLVFASLFTRTCEQASACRRTSPWSGSTVPTSPRGYAHSSPRWRCRISRWAAGPPSSSSRATTSHACTASRCR
jgi:hypothetical protein